VLFQLRVVAVDIADFVDGSDIDSDGFLEVGFHSSYCFELLCDYKIDDIPVV
jgi:hypothetical protein